METWREIVEEMRKQACTWNDRRVPNFCELSDNWSIMADRIEAACEQLEKAYNNAVSADARHCLENAKLRRALEPVMNACNEDSKCDAVREARAIAKGEN